MISRRRQERTEVSVPVRVWGLDANGKPFSLPAQTRDLTRYGARLSGVSVPLTVGEIVGVQHGSEKSRFRVVWCGPENSRLESEIGLYALDPTKDIWGEVLRSAPPPPAPSEPAADTDGVSGNERRMDPRYTCSGTVEVLPIGQAKFWATLVDVSASGCYVNTATPLQPPTRVQITLSAEGHVIRCEAESRFFSPRVGMGLKFLNLGPEQQRSLDALIAKLAAAAEEQRRLEEAARLERAAEELLAERTPSGKAALVSSLVYKIASDFRELEQEATAGNVLDPKLLAYFQSAVESVKQSAWSVQQWIDLREQRKDAAEVVLEAEKRQIETATALLRSLAAELESPNFNVEREGMSQLFAAAIQLYRRLAYLAEKRRASKS